MTIKDLEYFAAIARHRSITRASAALFIAQPALSQCLQKLEKETGLQLFVRESRGVILTSQGECFLRFAQNVLREQQDMKQRMQDVENGERGQIRLGFTGTQATYVLPHILPEFQAAHPGVSILLVEASSDEIETKLLDHEVDIGILHLPVLREALDWFELSRDKMVVVPRSDCKAEEWTVERDGRIYLQAEFLRTEPLILTPPEQRSRMVCDQIFAKAGLVPQIKQVSRNLSTLDALAQVDYASTIMPEKQLSPALRALGYYDLEPEIAVPYTFVVATARDSYLPIAVRTLQTALMKKQYQF
ncbi:MAG: LysR family transcriptional regulator [Oscillibacter sp.]|nr:LysR family transcriptional regulator [Oscillibacter sp.]